jgi:molybdopterin molybdotransferase
VALEGAEPVDPLIPVDEAIARIVAHVAPLPAESVTLADAAGRTLAEPLKARRMQPPFDASAMDGYALRAEDTTKAPVELRVIGMSAAGHRYDGKVGAGETVRIFTGAPVPAGADAILIQENARANADGSITVTEAVARGRYVRPAGLDFREGAALLEAGRPLGFRELALAAAMGHAALPVWRRPRVALIATGDELVPPGALPAPDQIVASSSPGLMSFIAGRGAEPVDLGIVRDDQAAIAATIGRALALPADIVVTLGGASVGEHDLVQAALKDRGMALDFWRIAMRPGKPLMFGRIGETRVLGLPGNPVSSLVCAILFLAPLIGALLGQPRGDPTETAILGTDMGANDARQDYVRARLTTRRGELPAAVPLPVQDSSMLSVLATADCLIVRPPNAAAAKAGEACRIIRLG